MARELFIFKLIISQGVSCDIYLRKDITGVFAIFIYAKILQEFLRYLSTQKKKKKKREDITGGLPDFITS